jgi:hypothetical protein
MLLPWHCLPFTFPAEKVHFLVLGEVRPFCILRQNIPANKARNRPCSISRAERKRHWPEFFASSQQYTCPSLGEGPGSDDPHQIGSIPKMLESLQAMRISDEDRQKILGGNAKRLGI